MWSVRGQLGAALLGHNGRLNSATFSPDGQWVVTASTDGTARVWSVRSGLLATLPVGGGGVFSAAFSSDGEWVVTASADGSARVWPVSARLLKERLDAATSDCLGGEERQAYLNETPEEAQAALEQCQQAHREK
jgi:WD40 repeat protein